MMAVTYGNIYVAQVALGADKAQTLRLEPLSGSRGLPWSSSIIAYAPASTTGSEGRL